MAEPDVSSLISVTQALAVIDSAIVTPRVVQAQLRESSGRRLAVDLLSDRDSPPFDKSLMDGFAVRAADLAGAPCELALRGRVAAGENNEINVGPGTAVAIMTGAPLPIGADAVVPVEQTTVTHDPQRIRFTEKATPGQFIARRGSEVKAQSIVLRAGQKLGAPQIAVAASIGAARVQVFEPPSVAILGTGDELIDIEQTPVGAQIRGSNNAMLMALLNRDYTAIDLGAAPDDPAKIREKILQGLKQDVLIIVGGMSMGERDFVPGILRELGATFKITKLRIKPGKPFIFAQMPGGKYVFGLPGNPVSAFVCCARFVTRLLDRMEGGTGQPTIFSAILEASLPANGPREFYLPAIFNGRSVMPLAWIGSADVFTLARANALIIRPENQNAQATGEAIDLLMI
ncbi:MAG: molybdopterin molybdotransferase MoeA [Planctomycetota bacterium]|nr:molybdopterin molybdotransferase MoeA [Planctomycetota bacterium]